MQCFERKFGHDFRVIPIFVLFESSDSDKNIRRDHPFSM